MMHFLLFLRVSLCILQEEDSYTLFPSLANNEVVLTKQVGSSSLLLLVSLSGYPVFEFDESLDNWKVSAEFFDAKGWILNLNTLQVSIPNTHSGSCYVSVYTDYSIPYNSISQSTKSPSSCLSTCQNSGICTNGNCLCPLNFGGNDCSIFFTNLTLNEITAVSLPALTWAFYRIDTNQDLSISMNSYSDSRFRIFIANEINTNELPTMLDSQGLWLGKNETASTGYVSNSGYPFRISIYCYASSACNGSFQIYESSSTSYLWVIIFSVLVGVFIVGSIPLILLHCSRSREKAKALNVQISKEQMEEMFPKKNWSETKEDVCSICLEALELKICRELACFHVFHEECIDEWAASNLNCPVCKQNMIMEYYNMKRKIPDRPEMFTENDEKI